MMKKLFFALSLALTIISCGKIEGEGAILTEDYTLSTAVSSISVGSAMSLELSEDLAPGEVKIETYGNIFQYLKFNAGTDKLSISLKDERYKGDLNIKIYASSEQYDSVKASGASSVVVKDPVAAQLYSVVLSGASKFTMGESFESIMNLNISLSGASKATLKGSTSTMSVDASGASSVDAVGLTCQDLKVNLSGSSDLKISVNGTVTGDLSGASDLKYRGDAIVKVKTSGSSKVSAF